MDFARGDEKLALCFADRDFRFKRWLRRNDASDVALVVEDGETHVLKIGPRGIIEREFDATRELQHDGILRPSKHVEGNIHSALLMPYFEGEHFVDAARKSVPKREAKLRQNLPMAFGYELNDLGESSFAHCREEGELRLRPWLATLGEVLDYVHARNRLHLDLAPDNILVQDERCVLLDFGLSCRTDQAHPGGHALIGSAAYLAPELGLGRLTPAADWYSLGVVLFQALTGGLPFEGGGPEVLVRKQSMSAPLASELCPEVAPDLDALCASWLTRDPKGRGNSEQLRALDHAT